MSGRRAVWLVARREIVERARERAFLISTAILVLLVVAVALAPALLDGAVAPARVGVVGDDAATLGRAAAERSARDGAAIDLRPFRDRTAAAAAVRAGRLDAALVPRGRAERRAQAQIALALLEQPDERGVGL